jgi:hypothetical protein
MKLTILAPALAMCGGLALAQNPGTTTSRPQDAKRPASEHKMTAEIVSTDASAQQITVRKLSMGGTTSGTMSGGTSGSTTTGSQSTGMSGDTATVTLRVEGKALTRLSSVKTGDMVTISCRAMGENPGAMSGSTSGTTTSTTGSGSTGATTSGAGTASASGGINSQAQADMHCASVTDISKK